MTWNPCGCVVDWSRRPFDCDARPFRDSDQVIRVRWFPAAPDAVAIPWPSNIDVPDWLRSFEVAEYPGTVPAEWPGNPYNRAVAVPGSGRGHVCGTAEQFAGEAALDPDADMQYRPDGLPVCCDPVRELKGGAGAGVQATVSAPVPFGLYETLVDAEVGAPDWYDYGSWFLVQVFPTDPLAVFRDTFNWGMVFPTPFPIGFVALEFDAPLPAGVNAFLKEGGDVGAMHTTATVLSGNVCASGVAIDFGNLFIQVTNNTATTFTMRLRVRAGPC